MIKPIAFAVLLSAAVIGPAPVASAGEWNPGRGYIHGEDHSGAHPAASVCAYSGLDDPDTDDNGLWGASPAQGRVQSPGQVVAFLGSAAAGIPGEACRGGASH